MRAQGLGLRVLYVRARAGGLGWRAKLGFEVVGLLRLMRGEGVEKFQISQHIVYAGIPNLLVCSIPFGVWGVQEYLAHKKQPPRRILQ